MTGRRKPGGRALFGPGSVRWWRGSSAREGCARGVTGGRRDRDVRGTRGSRDRGDRDAPELSGRARRGGAGCARPRRGRRRSTSDARARARRRAARGASPRARRPSRRGPRGSASSRSARRRRVASSCSSSASTRSTPARFRPSSLVISWMRRSSSTSACEYRRVPFGERCGQISPRCSYMRSVCGCISASSAATEIMNTPRSASTLTRVVVRRRAVTTPPRPQADRPARRASLGDRCRSSPRTACPSARTAPR